MRGLLRVLSTSTYLHEAASSALADELRAGRAEPNPQPQRERTAILVLSGVAALLHDESTLVNALAFLLVASKEAPVAIAAGLHAHGIRLDSASTKLSKLPAAQKSNAHKLAIELTCGLCTWSAKTARFNNLSTVLIARVTIRKLASLLVDRSVESTYDIASRSHAALQLIELVEGASPWVEEGGGGDAGEEVTRT